MGMQRALKSTYILLENLSNIITIKKIDNLIILNHEQYFLKYMKLCVAAFAGASFKLALLNMAKDT